jgi:hypothetical protein
MATKLDAATLRRLAVRASCSPKTIQKIWLGMPVRGLAGYRGRAALLEAGLAPRPRAVQGTPEGEA